MKNILVGAAVLIMFVEGCVGVENGGDQVACNSTNPAAAHVFSMKRRQGGTCSPDQGESFNWLNTLPSAPNAGCSMSDEVVSDGGCSSTYHFVCQGYDTIVRLEWDTNRDLGIGTLAYTLDGTCSETYDVQATPAP